MGEIIDSKIISNNRVVHKILLDFDEFNILKNHMKNINIFAAGHCKDDSEIIERGESGSTKYFSIPFSMRLRKRKVHDKISYQAIRIGQKVFYIYVLDKRIL